MNNFIYSITPIYKILRIFNSDYFCIFIVVYWHISLFIPPSYRPEFLDGGLGGEPTGQKIPQDGP